MRPIAIYDMDKTITREPTWTRFLIRAAWALAPLRLMLLPFVGLAALGYAMGLVDRTGLKQIAQRLMLGAAVPAQAIAIVAEAFADDLIKNGVFPGAVRQIAADRAAGCRLVLATASCHFYVDAFARRLGFDDVVATQSSYTDTGDLLARIAGENCYGPAKLRKILAWLAAVDLARDQINVRFYSDHVSDAPVFDWADTQTAVNPHAALRRLADQRGWAAVDWGS